MSLQYVCFTAVRSDVLIPLDLIAEVQEHWSSYIPGFLFLIHLLV